MPMSPTWSISKRTLQGGRREGVELIHVENSALAFDVIPTRGMGIWQTHAHGDRIGWRSPVTDGPVHPALVNLEAWGGLGWLDGFDELLARCGLESNGAPYKDGDRTYPLHGRIANSLAHFVAVDVDDTPPHVITIEGHVDETRLFSEQLRLVTKITTIPGSNRVVVRDEVTNLKNSKGEFQLLYHWNFGPPLLEEGARLVVAAKEVCPRTPEASAAIGHYDVYGPPNPGSQELVYFLELQGDGPDGNTLAMLRNRAGDKAIVLRFKKKELPWFTLWKCPRGLEEGYVTGLEPGVNLPNPRPFEKKHGRVVSLDPGQTYVAETSFEVLRGRDTIAQVETEVEALKRMPIKIHPRPVAPFARES
jgi:hypothetical protein